jgi:hypothetical protein
MKAEQKRHEVIMEESSDWITANYYVKIGLTRSQVKALTLFGKRWGCRKSPCAAMARYLVSLALIHQEDTEAKLAALLKYIEAEDFGTLGQYCDRAIILKGGAK